MGSNPISDPCQVAGGGCSDWGGADEEGDGEGFNPAIMPPPLEEIHWPPQPVWQPLTALLDEGILENCQRWETISCQDLKR